MKRSRNRWPRRPRWLGWLPVPSRPASRAGSAMLTIAVLLGAFAVAAGVGYTASRPLLGDGCAFLGKGHTVAHVCGETGKSDAEIAQQLATGKEDLQPVRLPDGRLAIVNQSTGTLSYFDTGTMTPSSAPASRPESAGKLEPVPTDSDGYLVDPERDTVEKIALPAQPPTEPVRIPDGIAAAVPSGDSLWVMTSKAQVVEVRDGRAVRTIRLGVTPAGLTVADSHPVVVAEDGNAYMLDASSPTLIGNIGLSGPSLKFGAWRGAGRYVVAVDPATGRVGVLDPRTGQQRTVQMKISNGRNDLDAPVMLGEFVYVPDRSGPGLWRIDLAKGTADDKPLDVPASQPGPFSVTVENGHVWANSQYDRRVLVVDPNGHHHYADKGPAPEVGDSQGQNNPPSQGGQAPTSPSTPPSTPPNGPQPEPQPGGPAPAPTVVVPTFPTRTPYRQACASITQLKLVCRPVAAGDRAGLRTGDVIETDPPAGTAVAEGSRVVVRYSGPLKTPSVVGIWHEDACRQIKAAKLACAETIDPNPALAPGQLGVVVSQSPGPQEQLPKGGTVTVTYPDSIALPSFLLQSWSAACDAIVRGYKMKCEATQGDPPAAGRQVGQVYQQNPAAPFVARIGATISLRYYRGSSKVPQAVGKNVTAACTEIQQQGFSCKPVEGRTVWRSGHAVNEVYQQSLPADGQDRPVGTEIALTYYSPNQDLPSYVSGDAGTACADVNARGFQCQLIRAPYRTTNIVEAQSQPAGRHPLGTAVVIYYNPYPLIDQWISRFGGGWALQPGSGTYRIGFIYPAGSAFDTGGRWIYQYTCGGNNGTTACRGYQFNVFYSRVVPPGTGVIDPDFQGNGIAVLPDCGAPGTRKIWRFWDIDANRRFQYGLVHSDGPPAGHSGVEELGCIWW